MALRFFDGFDHYTTAASTQMVQKGWTSVGASVGTSTTGSQFGTGRSLFANIQGFGGTQTASITLNNQPSWYVGVANYVVSTSGFPMNLIQLIDGSTSQLEVRAALTLQGGYTFFLTKNSGATVLAGPSPLYGVNRSHYIELGATIHSTTGTVELKVNGVRALIFTGNTQQTANAFANQIRFSMLNNFSTQFNNYIDDVYICDGTGTVNNTFLGPARIETLLPSGNGTTQQYTTSAGTNHASLVNESQPDGDTTYVVDSTPGNIDLFTTTPTVVGRTAGIQISQYSRKDDVATRQVANVVKLSATNYVQPTKTNASTFAYFTDLIEQNPATSADFTLTDLTNAQFGVKTIA